MSKTSEILANVETAIRAITALAGVTVKAAAAPQDAFRLNRSRTSEIYVCWGGVEHGPMSDPVGAYVTPVKGIVLIVPVADSRADGMAALTKTLGAFEMVEYVRGVRSVAIGPTTSPKIHLRLISETLTVPEDRDETGGAVGYICRYETSVHLV
jgi:hypothetical protein